MRNNNSRTIQRLLAMRQFPGLAEAELGEVAAVAENMHETFLPAGTVVARGSQLDAVHLVVDGALEAPRTGARWETREAFGALEVLAARGAPGEVIAATDTRTLQLPSTDFLELLEDNFSLLCGARRAMARRLIAAYPTPVRGSIEALVPPAVLLEIADADQLNMVERLILLRQHEPFRAGRIQALAALSMASEDIEIPTATLAQERDEAATGSLLVLDGVLRVTRPGQRDEIASAGSELGVFEALAELPYAATIEAITPVRALRIPTAALFDVMEDHTDFALSVLGRLASLVLDADETRSPDGERDLAN